MVTVYTTASCAFCPMVKKYLGYKNIEYNEIDVSDDAPTRNKLFQLTGMMTVPITTNGERYVVGFNPQKLANLIE